LPDLPVVIVGNGGGYGYGVMGATHHALEDYGALLCLQNLRAFIPASDADVVAIVNCLMDSPHPAYLRLGVSELPKGFELPEYAPWRCVLPGRGPTMLAAGPIVGSMVEALSSLDEKERPAIWLVSELPISCPPDAFFDDLDRSDHLVVVEEHVANGGVGQMISHYLLLHSRAVTRFSHAYAKGYVSGLYGSQRFHRKECGLDADTILKSISPKSKSASSVG
jgi:transketolase